VPCKAGQSAKAKKNNSPKFKTGTNTARLARAKSGIGVEIGLLGLVHFCSTASLCFWRHLDLGS
jgi:hypothetical protein